MWRMIYLLILTGCSSVLAPSTVLYQSEETQKFLELSTTPVMYQTPESSYVARQLVVTGGKEPTPTTLRTQHMPPNSYTLPISMIPSLSRNRSTISESSYVTRGTTYGSETPIPTTMRTQRPLSVSVGPSLSRNRSTISESSYITRQMVITYGSEHTEAPMPTARRTLQPLIPSLSSKRSVNSEIMSVPAFEGRLTSSQSVAITSEAVSATTGGQKSGVMSSKMAPTELKTTTTTATTTTTTTTTTHEKPTGTVTVVLEPSAALQPGGSPNGRPTGPPVPSFDHSPIYISISVIIVALIAVSGIGVVCLLLVRKYRAARRRVGDQTMGMDLPRVGMGGPRMKKRRNTPWHLYYAEPVARHNN